MEARMNPFSLTIISTIISASLLPLLINILYKLNFRDVVIRKKNEQKDNKVFVQLQGAKSGTPKSGGLVWLIVFPILTLMFIKSSLTPILLISYLVIGIIGLIEDSQKILDFTFDSKTRLVRFILQWVIAIITGYHMLNYNFYDLNTYLFIGLFAFLFVSYINAFNINDGLDGLMTGQAIWIFTGMLILTLVNGQTIFSLYYSIIIGSLIAFLYFNIHPARVFMGDVGSTTLGVLAIILAIASNNILPFMIMTIPTILDTVSSLIQMFSIRFLNRRVFKIAPIHHHFQAIGWEETKVTQRFWIFQIFCVFLALAIFA